MSTAVEKVNGTPVASAELRVDPRALAEAEAIRTKAEAEAEARRLEAAGKAEAEKIKAKEEAVRLRLANERTAMRLKKENADNESKIAAANRKTAEDNAAAKKVQRAEEDEAKQASDRVAEEQRSENVWKWGARGIYAVGLIIAAPIQFLHFWDPKRPFLVAAPGLLEGFALVLAFGAAWAVAHKRDVLPYRIGIMLGALIAAGINMYGGTSDDKIGLNAGIIGAIASLGGPIVLMAYEHGIAQKADGIPSRRERRAARKAAEKEAKARAAAKAEREAAAKKVADEKAEQQKRAEIEQARKDEDRKKQHEGVWEVADGLRAARGAAFVTTEIWADAWYLVTGSKKVGLTPEIEAMARAAQARMKAATEGFLDDDSSQVESQKAPRAKRDPDEPDGRRFNGGTPPIRRAGDTQPYIEGAKRQAAREQTESTAATDGQ